MKCENCGTEHEGTFGSGRFCSKFCAHSNVGKRGKGISRPWKKRIKKIHLTLCIHCGIEFDHDRKRLFCSKLCKDKHGPSVEMREKLSKIFTEKIKRGEFRSYLKSIKCSYEFKDTSIKCDSKVEYSCLNFFETNYKVISIKRADIVLTYKHDGINKSYLPDFIIDTTEGKFIVECKAEIGKNANVSRKWGYYYDTIEPKKEALKKYCNENNFISFFYNKGMNSKFYYSCKPRDVSPLSDKELKG